MTRSALPLFLVLLFLYACGQEKDVSSGNGGQPGTTPRVSRLLEPAGALTLAIGEDIPVRLEIPDSSRLDSVQFYLGGSLVYTLHAGSAFPAGGPVEARIPTAQLHTGKSSLRLKVCFQGGTAENQSRSLTLLSDQKPVEYSYTVVHEYAHDIRAYTQGLQFVDGWLYEGTGHYGTSSIRRVDLETGEVVQVRDLDPSLFGEGITVFGQRIYQLTYKSQVGFIYDRNTFREIQKIYYRNREGWGLSHNGKELIMSDGSHVIYFLDPELFTVNRQIEVYTDQGPAESLNELEYIKGKIWANRYYTDEIVIIDPETGKVEGRINLKGILKTADRKPSTDVLNGIAWDAAGNRVFVTGKYWPKLFEIRLRQLGSE
jgi:glutamine cyclotransferase